MKGYPRWFLASMVATMLLLFLTGVLLAPGTLMLKAELDLPWRLASSARVLMAALHAAGGFAMMLMLGALWSVHMRAGWRRRSQRVSGAVVATILLVLAVTAVLIYYLGDETLGAATALIHLAIGHALVVSFVWHWVRGRRARRYTHSGLPCVPPSL